MTKRKIKPADLPARIVLATDSVEGIAYATGRGWLSRFTVITHRSAARLRGRVGPVYATSKFLDLAQHTTDYRFADLIETARPCGATVPWGTDDEGRIA